MAEVVSGTDFGALARNRIMDPLGMTDSGFRLADIGTTNLAMPYQVDRDTGDFTPYFQYGYPDYPDGELRTSAAHLARWLGAFMNFGTLDGVRVLERDTVTEIRRHQLGTMVSWHQGLIWYGSSAPGYFRMGHTGGDYGVTTQMFFRPDTKVGVISLTNASLGGPPMAALPGHPAADVRGVLLGDGGADAVVSDVAEDPARGRQLPQLLEQGLERGRVEREELLRRLEQLVEDQPAHLDAARRERDRLHAAIDRRRPALDEPALLQPVDRATSSARRRTA